MEPIGCLSSHSADTLSCCMTQTHKSSTKTLSQRRMLTGYGLTISAWHSMNYTIISLTLLAKRNRFYCCAYFTYIFLYKASSMTTSTQTVNRLRTHNFHFFSVFHENHLDSKKTTSQTQQFMMPCWYGLLSNMASNIEILNQNHCSKFKWT